ncbi:hypothetical protein P154DRAFT_612264 [Amniculicola lignicola CBS 123094]|uniref:Uncharacterized protein n=1 Tax=Amniculicola lignicola CBS 123094 TaxID=1392246 RepID=A0A6A5VZQ8_9PLEO|nr:hypothetical protein P154DRAFT_612264 [Amniculicola lignicola CBS 123094]
MKHLLAWGTVSNLQLSPQETTTFSTFQLFTPPTASIWHTSSVGCLDVGGRLTATTANCAVITAGTNELGPYISTSSDPCRFLNNFFKSGGGVGGPLIFPEGLIDPSNTALEGWYVERLPSLEYPGRIFLNPGSEVERKGAVRREGTAVELKMKKKRQPQQEKTYPSFTSQKHKILTSPSLERRSTSSKRTTSWTGTLQVSTPPDDPTPSTLIGCIDTNGRLAIPSNCALMTIELYELGLLVRSTVGSCGYINNKLACADSVLDLLILLVGIFSGPKRIGERDTDMAITKGPGPNSVSNIVDLLYESGPTIGNSTNVYHETQESVQRRSGHVPRRLGTVFLGYIPCC